MICDLLQVHVVQVPQHHRGPLAPAKPHQGLAHNRRERRHLLCSVVREPVGARPTLRAGRAASG